MQSLSLVHRLAHAVEEAVVVVIVERLETILFPAFVVNNFSFFICDIPWHIGYITKPYIMIIRNMLL